MEVFRVGSGTVASSTSPPLEKRKDLRVPRGTWCGDGRSVWAFGLVGPTTRRYQLICAVGLTSWLLLVSLTTAQVGPTLVSDLNPSHGTGRRNNPSVGPTCEI